MRKLSLVVFAFVVCAALSSVGATESPFVGRWALTLPDGRAGWLGVEQKAVLQGDLSNIDFRPMMLAPLLK